MSITEKVFKGVVALQTNEQYEELKTNGSIVINGVTYTVEDRGGAIHGNRIDVYYDTHGECFSPACNTTAKVYIVNG